MVVAIMKETLHDVNAPLLCFLLLCCWSLLLQLSSPSSSSSSSDSSSTDVIVCNVLFSSRLLLLLLVDFFFFCFLLGSKIYPSNKTAKVNTLSRVVMKVDVLYTCSYNGDAISWLSSDIELHILLMKCK